MFFNKTLINVDEIYSFVKGLIAIIKTLSFVTKINTFTLSKKI